MGSLPGPLLLQLIRGVAKLWKTKRIGGALLRQTLDPQVTTLSEHIHAQAAAQPAPQTPLSQEEMIAETGDLDGCSVSRRGRTGPGRFRKRLLRDHRLKCLRLAPC
jgi:hypothetical protein